MNQTNLSGSENESSFIDNSEKIRKNNNQKNNEDES